MNLTRSAFRPKAKASKIGLSSAFTKPYMPTFQEVILRLQTFWDKQGCALLQPYDIEVGAGTFHTATFLRAIGPEPWNAAFEQPSRPRHSGQCYPSYFVASFYCFDVQQRAG